MKNWKERRKRKKSTRGKWKKKGRESKKRKESKRKRKDLKNNMYNQPSVLSNIGKNCGATRYYGR